MKVLVPLCLASSFMLSAAAVYAQTETEFKTQQSTAGWGLAEPDLTDAPSIEEETTQSEPSGPIVIDGQQYGWIYPSAPLEEAEEGEDRELTELEALSVSASGLTYGSGLYDSKSDNPLEPVSVTVRALDKITAKYTDIEINIDETANFGDLSITPRTCDKRPPEETPETTAFLIIDTPETLAMMIDGSVIPAETEVGTEPVEPIETENFPAAEPALVEVSASSAELPFTFGENVEGENEMEDETENHLFSGWMFASSPALNPLEHSVYDVWVIDCKMVDPSEI